MRKAGGARDPATCEPESVFCHYHKERHMHKLRQRLQREEGFTLIELLVVIVIIGILLAIAVPSYLGFRSRAQDAAAKSDLRAAVPSAEAWYADNGAYDASGTNGKALNTADMKTTYDSGLSSLVTVNKVAGPNSYCLEADSASGTKFYFAGPGGTVTSAKPAACA
jgi:type IV pilus assembly protein PilA